MKLLESPADAYTGLDSWPEPQRSIVATILDGLITIAAQAGQEYVAGYTLAEGRPTFVAARSTIPLPPVELPDGYAYGYAILLVTTPPRAVLRCSTHTTTLRMEPDVRGEMAIWRFPETETPEGIEAFLAVPLVEVTTGVADC